MRSPALFSLACLILTLPAHAAPAREPARRPSVRVPAARKPAPRPAPVAVAPQHPQFLRDIAPLLDRQGCSVAACHGKFGGRGDFALSLLTLAPEDDYAPIVLGARGRRVNLQDPEQSLLLQKPSMQVPHGGGLRLKRGSPQYQALLNWIKDGAPFKKEDARVESVTVAPARLVVPVGKPTQLKVTAKWSDGQVEDVTRKVVYTSADEPVARVTQDGVVTGIRWGGASIQVRFLGTVRAAFFTLPQVRKDRKPYPAVARANVIDDFIFDNLKKMNVLPAPLAGDAEFCRRVYLDTIGALPTPEELEAFLKECQAETAANGRTEERKSGSEQTARQRLIDRLLERPEFVDVRTLRIADLLRLNPRKISNNNGFGERSVVLFNDWIHDNVAKNRPWNEFVHDVLAARGSIYFNGPANYWAIERTPNDRAETTGQAFLGVRLQCARCHKHPFDRWTTDDYWDFSAFHGKVVLRRGTSGTFGDQEVVYTPGATVTNQSVNGPRKGLPARPTFLGQQPLTEEEQKQDISLKLADWVTAPDNPFFARATVNRLWCTYFGRGIVHPVDDMRETTPESVPGLLDALAKEFVGSGYDTKAMIRLILNSRAYQLSAETNDSNVLDDRFYSHFSPRPMLAQVLLDAINQATGTTERLTAFPIDRTAELPLPPNNYFLNVFGQAHREYLTDLDPKLEPNLVQTLHMMNSSYVNGKIRGGAYARELAKSTASEEQIARQAFLRTLCRPPTAVETAAVMKARAGARNRQEWVEDLLWSLISSREFMFIT